MRKLLLIVLLAALAAPAFAQTPKAATFAFKYDVDADGLTYCVLGGRNGDPFAPPISVSGTISTAGSSVTLTETTNTDPFRGLAVGDVLVIANQVGPAPAAQTYSFRTIVTATSVSSVDVDSAINLAGTGGHTFGYLKLSCGTAVTSGWVNVAGASAAAMTVQYEQGDLATGLRARFECLSGAIGALPAIIYPGETSDCGLGGTLATDKCNFATAGELARLTVAVDGAIFDRCRVGLEREGADASDAGAALEQVTATITVVK